MITIIKANALSNILIILFDIAANNIDDQIINAHHIISLTDLDLYDNNIAAICEYNNANRITQIITYGFHNSATYAITYGIMLKASHIFAPALIPTDDIIALINNNAIINIYVQYSRHYNDLQYCETLRNAIKRDIIYYKSEQTTHNIANFTKYINMMLLRLLSNMTIKIIDLSGDFERDIAKTYKSNILINYRDNYVIDIPVNEMIICLKIDLQTINIPQLIEIDIFINDVKTRYAYQKPDANIIVYHRCNISRGDVVRIQGFISQVFGYMHTINPDSYMKIYNNDTNPQINNNTPIANIRDTIIMRYSKLCDIINMFNYSNSVMRYHDDNISYMLYNNMIISYDTKYAKYIYAKLMTDNTTSPLEYNRINDLITITNIANDITSLDYYITNALSYMYGYGIGVSQSDCIYFVQNGCNILQRYDNTFQMKHRYATLQSGTMLNVIIMLQTYINNTNPSDEHIYRKLYDDIAKSLTMICNNNGGIPQYYYTKCNNICINDGAYVNYIYCVRHIITSNICRDNDIITQLKQSYDKAIDLLYDLQIIDNNGNRTLWAQYYHAINMIPMCGRKHEPRAISTLESCQIINMLKAVKYDYLKTDTYAKIMTMIESAESWISQHTLSLSHTTKFNNYDIIVGTTISQPNDLKLLARYYDIITMMPIYCNYDGRIVYDYNDIDITARNQYIWLGLWNS